MAVNVQVNSIDEIPEVMREFVTENDGVFSYDEERAFNALKNERVTSKTARAELKKFSDLGKTAEELAALIANATDNPDINKLNEAERARLTAESNYKALKKQLDELSAKYAESEKAAMSAKLRKAAEGLIDQIGEEYDKERVRQWFLGGKTADGTDIVGAYENVLKMNLIGELEEINGGTPLDYLTKMVKAFGFLKNSTPGNAKPGNAGLDQNGKNAAYEAAKKSGDLGAMLKNAPVKK